MITVIPDQRFAEDMEQIATPYLAERKTIMEHSRVPGHKIYCERYLADNPVCDVLISHGFTEYAEKYHETIYYLLQSGCNVYIMEHAGHGRSHRFSLDLSMVTIDDNNTYIKDILYYAKAIRRAHPTLPLTLFGHSMGGGIAAAAALRKPDLFDKLLLCSPMIEPITRPLPVTAAYHIAKVMCAVGKGESYVPGAHPFDNSETFEICASDSEARFLYQKAIRANNPMLQTNGASYLWLREAISLSRYLLHSDTALIVPTLILQAGNDTYVSKKAQDTFLSRCLDASILRYPQSKHEILHQPSDALQAVWDDILPFIR